MQKNCHLILSDIVTCGRKLSGEVFEYNHFQNLTQCYVDGRLILKDNVLLQPDKMPIQDIGILEGFTHQGTFIYLNTAGKAVGDWIEKFHQQYEHLTDIEFGISALQQDGFMIRILGYGAEQLFTIFQEVQQELWDAELLI